jgi:putative membrane protein
MTTLELIGGYWHFNIFIAMGAVLLLLVHLIGNRFKLNNQSILFFGGVILFLIATLSPLSFLAESYLFSAHMIKHITLLLIIPALLLSGMNGDFLGGIVRRPGVRQLTAFLFHPVTAWICGVGAMWVWHIPGLLGAEKISPFLQTIHLISLLILGLIFNWPVFAPVEWRKLPYLQSALYLFSACVGCTVLGILIAFAPLNVYTVYFTGNDATITDLLRNQWGITAETDQQAGGLIMWVPACMIYLTDIIISLTKWYRTSEAVESAN